MPTPEFFKCIAKEIQFLNFSFQSRSSIHRTTISRYYYYIFHIYREKLVSLLNTPLKKFMMTKGAIQHLLIQNTFFSTKKSKIIGYKLYKLRRLKNYSDYKTNNMIGLDQLKEAEIIVAELEEKISTIEHIEDLEDGFLKAISKFRAVEKFRK